MSVSVHNLAHLDDDEVVERFVVRQEELELLRGHLAEADPPRHVLVIAPRGLGKSLLVRRLAIAAASDPGLGAAWTPVLLPEELYTVTSIGEFWLAVLRTLAAQVEDAELRAAAEDLHADPDPDRLAALALGRIIAVAEQRGRRLLVVAENFDMLFEEQLTEGDGWSLRKALQNESSLLLVGTATASFTQIESHGSALYEFFRVVRLDGLDIEQTRTLWRAVTGASLPADQARPIQVLAGGNPRMLTILGQFTSRPDLSGLLDDLERLADEYTPYFKANIERLPPVQRKVFVTLADLWAPSTAAEVASRSRMDSSKVSALLGRMVKQGLVRVVDEIEGPRRYELVERLYQLFHLLRNAEQAGRVRALVDLIRHLYTPAELNRTLMPDLTRQLAGSRTHVLVASGLERHVDDEWWNLYRTRDDIVRRRSWLERLLEKQLVTLGPDAGETLATRREIAFCIDELGDARTARDQYEELADLSGRLLGPDHRDTFLARHQMACCVGKLGDREAALQLFRQLASDCESVLGPDDPDTLNARYWIAHWAGELGDREAALALFRHVADDAERVLGSSHRDTLSARFMVAHYVGELGDREAALALFRHVADDARRTLGPHDRTTLGARLWSAYYMGESGDREGALSLFRDAAGDAARAYGEDDPEVLRSRYLVAHYSSLTGRHADALALFRGVAEQAERLLGPDDDLTKRARARAFPDPAWSRGDGKPLPREFRQVLTDQESDLARTTRRGRVEPGHRR